MMIEMLDLVDANDHVIGSETRDNVYKHGLHNYRVIGIFLLDKENRILVPTRSMSCKMYPGCFDFSVAGHVLSGESYLFAAEREADEELGIPFGRLDLKEFMHTTYPNEYGLSSFSKYYYAYCDNDFLQSTEEVDSHRFISIVELEKLASDRPEMFKSDFLPVFNYFKEHVALI